MAENQKMKVTTKEQIRWRNRDIDKTDDSCVYHGTKDPKKKTYWKTWESKSPDYVEGSWNWVLFWTDEEEKPTATYESGLAGSEQECKEEIRNAIEARLRSNSLL